MFFIYLKYRLLILNLTFILRYNIRTNINFYIITSYNVAIRATRDHKTYTTIFHIQQPRLNRTNQKKKHLLNTTIRLIVPHINIIFIF